VEIKPVEPAEEMRNRNLHLEVLLSKQESLRVERYKLQRELEKNDNELTKTYEDIENWKKHLNGN
jgi:peptidoglycan hydrolase CwlO-like protein